MSTTLEHTNTAEANGAHVDVEKGLLFLPVGTIHFAQAHDLAHDLGVITRGFRLGIDLADVARCRGALFLQPLDALDEGFQAFRLNAALGHASCLP